MCHFYRWARARTTGHSSARLLHDRRSTWFRSRYALPCAAAMFWFSSDSDCVHDDTCVGQAHTFSPIFRWQIQTHGLQSRYFAGAIPSDLQEEPVGHDCGRHQRRLPQDPHGSDCIAWPVLARLFPLPLSGGYDTSTALFLWREGLALCLVYTVFRFTFYAHAPRSLFAAHAGFCEGAQAICM